MAVENEPKKSYNKMSHRIQLFRGLTLKSLTKMDKKQLFYDSLAIVIIFLSTAG